MQDIWKQRLSPWLTVAKIGVTVGLVVLLLSRVNPMRILQLWRHVDLSFAAIAFALIVPNMYFQYRRWKVGLLRVYPEIASSEAVRSILFGLAMGAVTPGRIGELGQVVILPSGGRRRALGVMGVMRIAAFFATITLGLAMWAWMPHLVRMETGSGRATALALLFSAVVAAVIAEWIFHSSDHPVLQRWIDRVPMIPPVFLGVQALRPVDRGKFFMWSIGMSVIYLSQLVYLMRAFGAEVAWLDGIAAGAITIGVVALLPITFGSLGVRETAAVIIWHQLGVPDAVAVSAAFALFLMNVLLPGGIGLIWNATRNRVPQAEPITR